MLETREPSTTYTLILRVIICISVLTIGFLGMKTLAHLKKPPSEAKKLEKPLRVIAKRMTPEDISIKITGYGELRAKEEVNISPEVSGCVTYVHPRLDVGEVIDASDILFQIDDRNYVAAVKELDAMIAQGENNLQRLKTQHIIDEKRLKTAKRNMELSRAEFLRVKQLFERNKVGTQSQVDANEKNYNSATDQFHLLTQTVDLYPFRIKEAFHSLAANKARLEVAQANLERCQVKSAFDGRVKLVHIEKGQFLNKGQHVLTLANDKQLEIQVPIDSRDAQKWLKFKHSKNGHPSMAWFDDLLPVTCRIRWTEAPDKHFWHGQLHRVVKFNEHTRTITVAVYVDVQNADYEQNNPLPMVEGMFCLVEIPGKILKNVYTLPRWAVSYENTVYMAEDSRLKTSSVTVEKVEPEIAIISNGIAQDDMIIITRLTDPMENALLDIAFE
ncbi:MAG: HlyD family efflux transporter periplasmic adaptor subunit [Candidatus Magnetomorum sp.]|nr:HlyD family efflux transporter periplasmic adaptor subunit [Candidatus Magnetomorum sp.]